jgi:hypothetical protein
MNTTIHLVVARYSQWDQWTPVKGFTSEDDAKAFAKSIVDANDLERKCFDQMLEARLPENGWKLATEAFEKLQELHPAPEFRGRNMEYQVQPLEVVSSA